MWGTSCALQCVSYRPLFACSKQFAPMMGEYTAVSTLLGTATGRYSCTNPNLLGIPSELRSVIPAPEHEFLELDVSQIELRVLAHFTESPELLRAFRRGTDLHRQTAAHVFGIQTQQVSDSQRRVGKGVNFAILYGQTAAGLASQLGVTKADAQGYIDEFYLAYSGVLPWIEPTQREVTRDGFVPADLRP